MVLVLLNDKIDPLVCSLNGWLPSEKDMRRKSYVVSQGLKISCDNELAEPMFKPGFCKRSWSLFCSSYNEHGKINKSIVIVSCNWIIHLN